MLKNHDVAPQLALKLTSLINSHESTTFECPITSWDQTFDLDYDDWDPKAWNAVAESCNE